MQPLSASGQQLVGDIAQRHGFSVDAVTSMLESVINGNGSMAQFNHPEFSGSGQWMQGGMTMVSDMFNNYLKGRVDGLCSELSRLVANQPGLLQTGSFQSQSQGDSQQQWQGGINQQQDGYGQMGSASLFVPPAPGTSGNWWPGDLGAPSSTGAQNNVRYAYFPLARRLAIDLNGRVTVYDTLDHQIGGFSQQQSVGGSISFNSQYGLVDVGSLPVVSIDGMLQSMPSQPSYEAPYQALAPMQSFAPAHAQSAFQPQGGGEDIFAAIEKLAMLHGKGILSDAEFTSKKAELLSRL